MSSNLGATQRGRPKTGEAQRAERMRTHKSSATPPTQSSGEPSGHDGSRSSPVWVVAAVVLGVLGVAGSFLAASAVAGNDNNHSKQLFQSSSQQIASTLQLAIQHEQDLVVNAGGFVAGNPTASNRQFVAWANSVNALGRYPELLAFGSAVIVSAADLPAFAARAETEPPGPLGPKGTFQVIPPGSRPFYCLPFGQVARTTQSEIPAAFDFCANGGYRAASLSSRDTGQSAYLPLKVGNSTLLAISTPVYRVGVVPATVGERRAAFVGWTGVTLTPDAVLKRALLGHPGVAVNIAYHAYGSNAVFHSGRVLRDPQSVVIDLHNGWTVTTFAPAAASGVLGNVKALAALIGGIVVSLLLAILVFVLGTGRVRALRLVSERTAQLRQAQAELVDAARQAGMAEIATNVLHNVGNVLNSVNVSAELVGEKVRGSKSAGLSKAVALMHEHADDLGGFLTTDVRGRQLPGYLEQLAMALTAERDSIDEELLRLTKGVGHIKQVVNAQQALAGVAGVREPVRMSELLEDAVRMSGVLGDSEVTLVRNLDGDDDGLLSLDKHRVLLVLLNLIGNSMHAMKSNAGRPGQLTLRSEPIAGGNVRIMVADNGVGIPPENLTRIFQHGFTTHADGHGYGLHSSALAATEMGGALTVHSDGPGTGAVFTLTVPLDTEVLAA